MSRVPALLVEGVPGIGKSTLIDGMIRRHVQSAEERKIRTPPHLSQTWTYGPLAPAVRQYTEKFGPDDKAGASHFSAEQTRFDEMFTKSTMTKKALENDGTVADVVYRFWRE